MRTPFPSRRVRLTLAALLAALFVARPHLAAQDLPRGPAQRGVNASEAPDVWLATPEGFRQFDVSSVHTNEPLGGSATYAVEAATSDLDLTASSLLGSPVTLGVRRSPSRFVYFQGIVRSAQVYEVGGPDEQTRHVHVDIASPLALLSMGAHDRVFEDVTLAEVVNRVFARYPGLAVRVDARLPGDRRTYVQRDESDLDFLQRLFEPEGCALLIEGDEQRAVAVLTDGRGRRRHVRHVGASDGFPQLMIQRRLPRTFSVVQPPLSVGGAARVLRAETPSGVYGQPEAVVQLPPSVSDEGARRVLRGLRGADTMGTATLSGGPFIRAGDVLRAEGHENPALDGDYRVLSSNWGWDARSAAVDGAQYATITLTPAAPTLPGRSPLSPRWHGLEPVLVVAGPDGHARVDAAGRVRVRFGWGPQPDGTLPELWAPVLGPLPPGGATGFVMFEGGRLSAPRVVGFEAP